MEYRINQRTGDKISVLGLGGNYVALGGEEAGVEIVRTAYEGGVNFFDLATSEPEAFPIFGKALADVREHIIYQLHFGAEYTKGTYGRCYDLEAVKESMAWQLHHLQADYIDYGFIHCIDGEKDWNDFKKNGVLDYIKGLKAEGTVRHIGLSTHTPKMANLILDEVPEIDMLMFSINPAYDFHEGRYALGSADEREALYKRCEEAGIGISVMKPFSGGLLFDEEKSPFGQVLTPYQCVQYALDKPGVLTILPGFETKEELLHYLDFEKAPAEERDYSIVDTFDLLNAEGKCVYCSHCQPCPAGIDIGLVNKYYDVYLGGDPMAKEHYKAMEKTADYCIACGKCNQRCPFHVDQLARMKEIAKYFGEE